MSPTPHLQSRVAQGLRAPAHHPFTDALGDASPSLVPIGFFDPASILQDINGLSRPFGRACLAGFVVAK